MKNTNFDGSAKNYLMRNNGFSVGFNMPDALEGDRTFSLPPYAKRMPYLVDKHPACPKDWLRSEGIVKSYFVPVIEGKGMWLDFNENENHTRNVAIVVSVQGINPITGMPCKDAQLEQYTEECPKHKVKFGPDRYCSKCDYKWPKQNYIATNATPRGQLWLDGFRTVEGVVRQYILTAEKMRGVASNVIGKDRVYAIGLSFFVSKDKKPVRIGSELRGVTTGGIIYNQPMFFSPVHTPVNWGSSPGITTTECDNTAKGTLSLSSSGTKGSQWHTVKSKKCSKSAGVQYDSASISFARSIQTTKLEVGAGAKINQSVHDDPEKLEFWHDKPESIICINYATENEVMKIIEQGEVNIEGHKEGFLKEVPVGN